MAQLLGIENSATESGVVVRKGHITATPDQATGYEATAALTESQGTHWRTTDTDPDSTRALVRLPQTRALDAAGILGHNLGRHGTLRMTGGAASSYAVRPAWESDGVNDVGQTTASIPATADVTLLVRLWLRHQLVAHNTADLPLLDVTNALGARFAVYLREGDAVTPWVIYAKVTNWGTPTATTDSTIAPDGLPHDIAARYRTSDDLFEVLVDGVVACSATATTPWSDNGAERLTIGAAVTVATFSRVVWQDIRYVGRYLTDAEVGAYGAEAQSGTERDLIGAWHFLEGSGATVDDPTGNADMTLTGGTWLERVNPTPACSSGTLEAWGQWRRRQAMAIVPGVYATSPVLGSAERSVTLSCLVNVPADAALVGNELIAWYGPSATAPQISITLNATGQPKARTFRGAAQIVTAAAAINDGVTRRIRATLSGQEDQIGGGGTQSTLELWVGDDGEAETSVGTNTAVAAFSTVANCKLGVGDDTATAEATCHVADVRLYSMVVLEADDDLRGDVGGANPELLAHLHLDGSVVDSVDTSRSYTVSSSPAPTYVELSQTATRELVAGGQRIVDAAGDPFERVPHQALYALAAQTDVAEVYLEMWDASNADGHIRVCTVLLHSGFRPINGIQPSPGLELVTPALEVSLDGLRWPVRGHYADRYRATLANLSHAEREELLPRLRRDPSRLISWFEDISRVQPRATLNAIVGTLGPVSTTNIGGIHTLSFSVTTVRRPGGV